MENLNNDNIYDNIESAKTSLFKATNNLKLSKYITKDKVMEAFSNIVICKDEEEFIKQVKLIVPDAKSSDSSVFNMRAFQAVDSKRIVFRNDCRVEEIVHEIVHYISLDGEDTGIFRIGNELISDEKNSDWEGLNELHIDVLNEAMTHYITQEILPERTIQDAYTYGGIFLRDYAQASGNAEKILDSYFGKDKNSLDFIAKDINKENLINWHDILEVSGVYQYTNTGIFRNFAKNFEKCNNERKRINVLIERISQRNIEHQSNDIEQDEMEI